ncbi:hypothetical protein NBZ79_15135 [Sneathiella marina]|uniref:Uncharacterized protein n=1 Tax=Sneathiella marina TaxID=2950108 RepID=A0ABY4W085_9PROT|nr:hypothetical protein [Sneathiella marina]USG60498.1 hypothetical protein NBZ79_15135 [Sneathiella marina]
MKYEIEQRVGYIFADKNPAQEKKPEQVAITLYGLKLPLADRIFMAVEG